MEEPKEHSFLYQSVKDLSPVGARSIVVGLTILEKRKEKKNEGEEDEEESVTNTRLKITIQLLLCACGAHRALDYPPKNT